MEAAQVQTQQWWARSWPSSALWPLWGRLVLATSSMHDVHGPSRCQTTSTVQFDAATSS
jgi:hypothetical protein